MPTEEEETINTEANFIAGNPLDGPAGNTAARPEPAVGMPSATGSGAHVGNPTTVTSQPLPAGPAEIPDPNFNNSTRAAYHDQAHRDNQGSTADRGEFGTQGGSGTTHGGFGNQFREGITEHEGPADMQYYGEGVVRPDAGDHNAYRSYDGHDTRADVQPAAKVVHDTPAPPPGPADAAAFLNDNGSAETRGAGGYAPDYGHTSGVGLNAPSQPQATPPAAGRNQSEGQHSSRGGYDNQGSTSDDAASAPAPTGATTAPQGEGYGYGYERSEQPQAGDSRTGAQRQGSTPGTPLATHGSDATQGYGSRGGSYDDKNPGARADADQQSQPATDTPNRATQPADEDADYGSAPRRNAGRDEADS